MQLMIAQKKFLCAKNFQFAAAPHQPHPLPLPRDSRDPLHCLAYFFGFALQFAIAELL